MIVGREIRHLGNGEDVFALALMTERCSSPRPSPIPPKLRAYSSEKRNPTHMIGAMMIYTIHPTRFFFRNSSATLTTLLPLLSLSSVHALNAFTMPSSLPHSPASSVEAAKSDQEWPCGRSHSSAQIRHIMPTHKILEGPLRPQRTADLACGTERSRTLAVSFVVW